MERDHCRATILEDVLIKPRLKITYPHVAGLADRKVQAAINQQILDRVYALIREQGYIQDPTKEMTGTYEVKLNERCVLSVVLSNYAYAKGAAHGLTIQRALTADLETGRIFTLQSLFKPNSGYRARLSDAVKKQIKERDIPLISEFTGIDPEHQDFYMTPQDLVLFFQLYEYTPYVYGFPEFPIPYTELEDMLSADSPIRRFLPGS